MDFTDLEALRRLVAETTALHEQSLRHYLDPDTCGYRHLYSLKKGKKYSNASTATCVLSLVDTGKWDSSPGAGKAAGLADKLLRGPWKSADLHDGNPFTTAFLLEAVTALERAENFMADQPLVEKATKILVNSISGDGGAEISNYPKSAYLTQLVVRTLLKRRALPSELSDRTRAWAWREMEHQIALITSSSKAADIYGVAYAAIICSSLTQPPSSFSPEQKRLEQTAIELVFKHQLPDGSWPQSRPLFHYPGVGNAYCYEYEMLVQLLTQGQLRDMLLEYLPCLAKSAQALKPTAFVLENGGYGWASNHHPQVEGPES